MPHTTRKLRYGIAFFLLYVGYVSFLLLLDPAFEDHSLQRMLNLHYPIFMETGTPVPKHCTGWNTLDCAVGDTNHQLYNLLLFTSMKLTRGLGSSSLALPNVLVMGLFVSFFLLVVWWVLGQLQWKAGTRVLATCAVLFFCPGLTLLLLQTEDNVGYYGFAFLFFTMLARTTEWKPGGWKANREPLSQGAIAGICLGLGILLNPTLLVYLFLVAAAPLLWKKQRASAIKLLVMFATSTLFYYALFFLLSGFDKPSPLAKHVVDALLMKSQGRFEGGGLARFFQPRYIQEAWYVVQTVCVFPKYLILKFQNQYSDLFTLSRILWAGVVFWATLRWWSPAHSPGKGPLDRNLMAMMLALSLALAYLFEVGVPERWDLFLLCFFLWSVAQLPLENRPHWKVWMFWFLPVQFYLACQVCLYDFRGPSPHAFTRLRKEARLVMKGLTQRDKIHIAFFPKRFSPVSQELNLHFPKGTRHVLFVGLKKRKATLYRHKEKGTFLSPWFFPKDLQSHTTPLTKEMKRRLTRGTYIHPTLRKQLLPWLNRQLAQKKQDKRTAAPLEK